MSVHKKMLKLLAAFSLGLGSIAFSHGALAAADACEGLSGAAKGICNAATVKNKCTGEGASANEQACSKLADNYRKVTEGQEPPWLIQCPCFASQSVDAFVAGNESDLSCTIHDDTNDTPSTYGVVISNNSGSLAASATIIADGGMCDTVSNSNMTSVNSMSEESANTCIAQLKRIAQENNTECVLHVEEKKAFESRAGSF